MAKAAKSLQGKWLGADGEYVATIRGCNIHWPDGSKIAFQPSEGEVVQLNFELDNQAYSATATAPERLEFSDGDVWLKPKPKERKVSATPRKRKEVPEKARNTRSRQPTRWPCFQNPTSRRR
ncbi:unnamed protein product [Effrenium voratum]|nr:unnamed protein product [Effrenium voratum]